MFLQRIKLESISFFEPQAGVWRRGAVEEPTPQPETDRQDLDEKALEAFCRRSLD